MNLLLNKTALITGAARGIGRAIALRFASEGCNIAFTDLVYNDLVEQTDRYADHYTPEDKEAFLAYTAKQLASVEPELDREALRDIFLRIYSNPVKAKGDLSHMEE